MSSTITITIADQRHSSTATEVAWLPADVSVIIELKKADRRMRTLDLIEQGARYKTILSEVLARNTASATDPAPPTAANYEGLIEVVFVLGSWPTTPEGDQDPIRTAAYLRNFRGRVVTYGQLVANARKAYDDFLRMNARVNRITQITDALMAPPTPVLLPPVPDRIESDE